MGWKADTLRDAHKTEVVDRETEVREACRGPNPAGSQGGTRTYKEAFLEE